MNGMHLLRFLTAIAASAAGSVIDNNPEDYRNAESVTVTTTGGGPTAAPDENSTSHHHLGIGEEMNKFCTLNPSYYLCRPAYSGSAVAPGVDGNPKMFLNLIIIPKTFVQFARGDEHGGSLATTAHNVGTTPAVNGIPETIDETDAFKGSTQTVLLETGGPGTSTSPTKGHYYATTKKNNATTSGSTTANVILIEDSSTGETDDIGYYHGTSTAHYFDWSSTISSNTTTDGGRENSTATPLGTTKHADNILSDHTGPTNAEEQTERTQIRNGIAARR